MTKQTGDAMTRRFLPRLIGAAVTVAAVVAALTAIAGKGFAETTAAQANYAPTNTAPPTISGTPQVGQTLTARGAFVGRFHVSDSRGFVVRDTLVKVTGLPYSWAASRTEVKTGQDGWATLTIVPTRNIPLGKRAALVMFVRARVEGQSLLAGSST